MSRSIALTKKLVAGLAASSMLIVAGPALAWDGVVSGIINVISITGGSNQGLRVYIYGVTVMCTNGASWGYLNETDSNYKSYAAAVMMAKAQGSPVTIYTTLENGYCHIGYISIQ